MVISASGVRLITKNELESYFTDLTCTEEPRYFRPTPGRIRSASCPSICNSVAVPGYMGSEEYLDSEKYQVRHWALDCTGKPHTQGKTGIATGSPTEFFSVWNGSLLCYERFRRITLNSFWWSPISTLNPPLPAGSGCFGMRLTRLIGLIRYTICWRGRAFYGMARATTSKSILKCHRHIFSNCVGVYVANTTSTTFCKRELWAIHKPAR